MDAINPTHILLVLTAVAIFYAGWMMYFTMRESRRGDKPDKHQSGSEPAADRKPKSDIVGKSRVVLDFRRHSQPQAAIAPPDIKSDENPDIFAPEDVPEHPRQIAPEELDKVFGVAPEGEKNEPLEIDQPLYDNPFPENEAEDEDDEDENEDLPLWGRQSAQGVSYDQLGEAYRHVVHNPTITDEQKEETGRVLLNLKGTDMFEVLVSGSPKREDKITYLIDTYLTAFNKRMSEERAESLSPQGVAAPSDFTVRNYLP